MHMHTQAHYERQRERLPQTHFTNVCQCHHPLDMYQYCSYKRPYYCEVNLAFQLVGVITLLSWPLAFGPRQKNGKGQGVQNDPMQYIYR